jgi:hypothetical protein
MSKIKGMRKISMITTVIILGFTAAALAEISLKAEVDKKSITTDEYLTYKLLVSTDEGNIPQPQLPKFEGFRVLSSAQTSEIRFANGAPNVGAVFVFILGPIQTGKLKIEPSSIKVKDKTYASDAFEIEVTQGKTKPQPPAKPIPESEEPQYTL